MSTPPRIVLVTHGHYGAGLLHAAEALVGPLEVELVEDEGDHQQTRARIAERVGESPALFLIDLCGSSPANVCIELTGDDPRREMLSGVSLATLLKLSTVERTADAGTIALQLQESTRKCVLRGSELGGCVAAKGT